MNNWKTGVPRFNCWVHSIATPTKSERPSNRCGSDTKRPLIQPKRSTLLPFFFQNPTKLTKHSHDCSTVAQTLPSFFSPNPPPFFLFGVSVVWWFGLHLACVLLCSDCYCRSNYLRAVSTSTQLLLTTENFWASTERRDPLETSKFSRVCPNRNREE